MPFTQQALDLFAGPFQTALSSHTPDQGSGWVADLGGTDWDLGVGNTASYEGSTADARCRNTTALAAKQAAELTVATISNAIGLFLLLNSSGDGYGALWRPNLNDMYIQRFTGGGRTGLTSNTSIGTANVGDVFRFETDGAGNFTAYINGVSQLTASDSTYTSGVTGLWGFNGPIFSTFSHFVAYDDAGGGGGDILLAQALL